MYRIYGKNSLPANIKDSHSTSLPNEDRQHLGRNYFVPNLLHTYFKRVLIHFILNINY